MLNLNNNQPQQAPGTLSLGVSSFGQPAPAAQNPWGQQPQQMGAMGAFAQGAGFQPQPVQPPSDLEVQIMLLRGIVPVDRFIASPQMGVLVEMLNNIVSYSVLEVMKNAVFTEDGDGNLKMDITKLPQHLQTMSAENIKAEFNTLQSGAQQNITLAEQGQSQIAAYSQQNMMSGALSAALADEGMMEKMGSGVGSVARGLMGLR